MSSFLKSPAFQAFLARLLAGYMRGVLRLQFGLKVVGREHLLTLAQDEPVIAAFWHETLPFMPVLWREARKAGMKRPAVVLASRHRDGQLIGNIARAFGVGLVSGSSSNGGAAGLHELVRLVNSGTNVALTPDGPRGPARRAAAGVAALAGLTGAVVLPCAAATSRFITLKKSWDGMRIPLPFGRVVLVCGTPLHVERETWRAALPLIEAALNDARERAAP
ncbi:MAG: lysophospholipid acyltransferase family protein [Rhodospirillales bacterium]|nr:lysophospholipid acyltransferase family protein [Rhodospirillales bacterium]